MREILRIFQDVEDPLSGNARREDDPTGRSRTPMLRIGRLHWVLDVSMDEDRSRNRKGNGAACLAVVQRLA